MKEVNLDLPIIQWTKCKGYEMYDSGFAEGEARGKVEGKTEGKPKENSTRSFLS